MVAAGVVVVVVVVVCTGRGDKQWQTMPRRGRGSFTSLVRKAAASVRGSGGLCVLGGALENSGGSGGEGSAALRAIIS